jgi:aminoacrylate hydrolase
MARIDVGRITLNVEEMGEGPAFIFIPGLVGLLNAWQYQREEFSKRYRCISFDHRGAGESDRPPLDQYSTREIAADVIALMDTLGIDKAHVAGTSTGGAILQNLAIDHADRLRCCIFSNTWTKADEYVMRVQTARKQIALSEGQEAYVKISSLFTNGANQFRYNLDRVMEIEKRSLETIAPPEILAARLDMTMNHDRLDELHKIRNPSLIIGTRDDATVPYYFSEDLHAAIEGSRLILVEEGGHYSFRRHYEEWNQLVWPFLDEMEGKV